jgi:hypothetical protein
LDIVGGIVCVGGIEGKVVTGVDDHSRFCVIAAVVRRATGRAVCGAFVEALQRFGIPDEVLTDNGKQFTGRFNRPRPGEVMFERICRENGIVARNTKPRTPTTTGKVERFHQTLQRELLDDHRPFDSLEQAQQVIDAFRDDYNTNRPHQSLGMAFPADRFAARESDGLGLRLPPSLATTTTTVPAVVVPSPRPATPPPSPAGPVADVDLAVELDRTVPPSGNLAIGGQQFWFGPQLAGVSVTLWADTTVAHLMRDGHRLKTVPSRLTPAHLRQLLADGGRTAGPSPLPTGDGSAVEVDRLVNAQGLISLARTQCPIGYHLAGQRVTIRLDGSVLQILDHERTLIRSLPNPLPPGVRPRDGRPGGPPPHVPESPPVVQRRVSERGVIQVARQKINLGIGNAGRLVDIYTDDTSWRIHHDNELLAEVPRTTTSPVARFKAHKPERPRRAPL